jgi:hypothetical protein
MVRVTSAESAFQIRRAVPNPNISLVKFTTVPLMDRNEARSESRFQRWLFWDATTLGRSPRFATANPSCGGPAVIAAPLALNAYGRERRTSVRELKACPKR